MTMRGAACVLGTALAACSGGASTATSSPTLRTTSPATPTARATPSPTETGAVSDLVPDMDTPLAQATEAQRTAWQNLGITTTIPGKEVFTGMPPVPKVLNATNGKLSDADAQALAAADYRYNALEQWAFRHVEAAFITALVPEVFQRGPSYTALNHGATRIELPDCDSFPASISVVSIDPTLTAFFIQQGRPIPTNKFAVVDHYPNASPCTATAVIGGQMMIIATATVPMAFLLPSDVRNDEVLGEVLSPEAGLDCSKVPTSACP